MCLVAWLLGWGKGEWRKWGKKIFVWLEFKKKKKMLSCHIYHTSLFLNQSHQQSPYRFIYLLTTSTIIFLSLPLSYPSTISLQIFTFTNNYHQSHQQFSCPLMVICIHINNLSCSYKKSTFLYKIGLHTSHSPTKFPTIKL